MFRAEWSCSSRSLAWESGAVAVKSQSLSARTRFVHRGVSESQGPIAFFSQGGPTAQPGTPDLWTLLCWLLQVLKLRLLLSLATSAEDRYPVGAEA